MARFPFLTGVAAATLAMAGGSLGADEPKAPSPPSKAGPGAAEAKGPALQGRVVDEAGRPLPGTKVILYAGFATRKKIAEAQTGADGRYRFDAVRSSMIMDRKKNREDYNVGIRVENPTHVESDGHSWRDIQFPSTPSHVETLDLRLAPAGRVEGTLTDAKTGAPLKGLDLRISNPPGARGHGVKFHVYATTDDQGRFRTGSLFPGDYDIEANSTTLDYAHLGRVKIEPGKTTPATFAVALPRVIEGRVLDAAGKPLGDVEVTILAPGDSDAQVRSAGDLQKVRSRAWTITRPAWQERFQLALLPGLEESKYVLAVHKELGWAKVSVEGLAKGEPIRLQPWKP